MLPGEMVTTFKPAPGAEGGCDGGATCVVCCEMGSEGGGPNACAPAGPVPDGAPTAFEGQSPLEPTLRTGLGGTFGIGLFWSVIDSLSFLRSAPAPVVPHTLPGR